MVAFSPIVSLVPTFTVQLGVVSSRRLLGRCSVLCLNRGRAASGGGGVSVRSACPLSYITLYRRRRRRKAWRTSSAGCEHDTTVSIASSCHSNRRSSAAVRSARRPAGRLHAFTLQIRHRPIRRRPSTLARSSLNGFLSAVGIRGAAENRARSLAIVKSKVEWSRPKRSIASGSQTCLAAETHVPHGISRSVTCHPTFSSFSQPTKAGTRLSDPGGMQS